MIARGKPEPPARSAVGRVLYSIVFMFLLMSVSVYCDVKRTKGETAAVSREYTVPGYRVPGTGAGSPVPSTVPGTVEERRKKEEEEKEDS